MKERTGLTTDRGAARRQGWGTRRRGGERVHGEAEEVEETEWNKVKGESRRRGDRAWKWVGDAGVCERLGGSWIYSTFGSDAGRGVASNW